MLFRSNPERERPADISAGLDRHRGGRGPQRGSETLRNGFAHSTTPVRLADPPYSDRLRDSVTKARLNPLWQPMQVILEQHMTEQTGSHRLGSHQSSSASWQARTTSQMGLGRNSSINTLMSATSIRIQD